MYENLALYIVVMLFIGGIWFTLKQIYSRIAKNEEDLKEFKKNFDQKLCDQYDLIRGEYKALSSKMEINKKEILDTISRSSSSFVSEGHFDLKQDLWNVRFSNVLDKMDMTMKQNETEHGRIVDALTASAVTNSQQLTDLMERIDGLSECVSKIQQKKEC